MRIDKMVEILDELGYVKKEEIDVKSIQYNGTRFDKLMKELGIPSDGRVIGYKGFDSDMKCANDFQYQIGQTYTADGEIRICENGYHFCEVAGDTFFYYFGPGKRYAIVVAEGEIERARHDSKSCCRKITIVRELDSEELYSEVESFNVSPTVLLNTADWRWVTPTDRGTYKLSKGRRDEYSLQRKAIESVANAQDKAKTRKVKIGDVFDAIKYAENRLTKVGIPKSEWIGFKLYYNPNAQSFPLAYRYTPKATWIEVERMATTWAVIGYRGECTNNSVEVEYTDRQIEIIKERAIERAHSTSRYD